MQFLIKNDRSQCCINFSDEEIKIIKKNGNKVIIDKKDIGHLKNHLMRFIVVLHEASGNMESPGDKEIEVVDISKK